jgi:quercetin dioxygenase-like cupin family protein
MPNFYDDWLKMYEKSQYEISQSRKKIDEEELEWVDTVQDHKAALMISPETGFRTWGTTTMTSEIPPGAKTGQHKHGEESILIVRGTGYSVVDNVRYDWHPYSVLGIPFGSVHQHFNNGDETVRMVQILTPHLEHWCGLSRFVQLEEKGMIGREPDVETSPDGLNLEGTRIVLHREDAPRARGEGDGVPIPSASSIAALGDFDPEHPLILGDLAGMGKLPPGFHHGGGRGAQYQSARSEVNGFKNNETEISSILSDEPYAYGGMHAHMEAHLYCTAGHGYTSVGDEKVYWKPGTAWWVPGPQTPHRHVNESDEHSEMVRIAFGIRYFFERAAKREFPYLYLSPRQAVLEANKQGAGRR